MAIKWTKQDVIKRVMEALNSPGPEALPQTDPREVLNTLLQAKQGNMNV